MKPSEPQWKLLILIGVVWSFATVVAVILYLPLRLIGYKG